MGREEHSFTVSLTERRSDVLVRPIDGLRAAMRAVKDTQPFAILAMVVLPEDLRAIEFRNARCIIERSNLSEHPDKVTEITYYVDKVKWIVQQAEDETVVGADGETVSHVDRTIDDHGKVVTEDNNGVVTTYSYTENGAVRH